MSKELKALENIKRDLEYITRLDYVDPIVRGEVRDELYKIYHRELPELDIIERGLKRLEEIDKYLYLNNKKLKALDIIKEKRVDIRVLQECSNLEEYNEDISMNWNDRKEAEYHNEILTQEEYDLLKEELL